MKGDSCIVLPLVDRDVITTGLVGQSELNSFLFFFYTQAGQ